MATPPASLPPAFSIIGKHEIYNPKDFLQEIIDKERTGHLTKVEELYITTAKRKNELW